MADLGSAAVLARSVIAATHGAHLLVPGAAPVPVGYVEDDGQPILVVTAADGRFCSSSCLTVTSADAEVHLGGRFRRLCHADSNLADLLNAHARCLVGSSLRPGRVDLIRLDVERVAVRPSHAHELVSVPVDDYALAEPEPFAAYQHRAIAHLQDRHGPQLVQLAADHLATEPAEIAGLVVREISARSVEVDVVTVCGGWTVHLPIRPAITDPRELCRRLVARG